jgi:hypothetical protein
MSCDSVVDAATKEVEPHPVQYPSHIHVSFHSVSFHPPLFSGGNLALRYSFAVGDDEGGIGLIY